MQAKVRVVGAEKLPDLTEASLDLTEVSLDLTEASLDLTEAGKMPALQIYTQRDTPHP